MRLRIISLTHSEDNSSNNCKYWENQQINEKDSPYWSDGWNQTSHHYLCMETTALTCGYTCLPTYTKGCIEKWSWGGGKVRHSGIWGSGGILGGQALSMGVKPPCPLPPNTPLSCTIYMLLAILYWEKCTYVATCIYAAFLYVHTKRADILMALIGLNTLNTLRVAR